MEGRIRRKKVLTGMPSLVKAAERQRTERGVNNPAPHRAEDSGQQQGAARAGKRFVVRLNQPKQSPGS